MMSNRLKGFNRLQDARAVRSLCSDFDRANGETQMILVLFRVLIDIYIPRLGSGGVNTTLNSPTR